MECETGASGRHPDIAKPRTPVNGETRQSHDGDSGQVGLGEEVLEDDHDASLPHLLSLLLKV